MYFTFFTSINTPRCIELLPPCVDLQEKPRRLKDLLFREVSNPRIGGFIHQSSMVVEFFFFFGDTLQGTRKHIPPGESQKIISKRPLKGDMYPFPGVYIPYIIIWWVCRRRQYQSPASSNHQLSGGDVKNPWVHEKMTIAGKFPFSIGDTYIDSFMVDFPAIVMLVNSGGYIVRSRWFLLLIKKNAWKHLVHWPKKKCEIITVKKNSDRKSILINFIHHDVISYPEKKLNTYCWWTKSF